MDAKQVVIPNEVECYGMRLYDGFAKLVPKIKDLETTSEDIFIATYPRSGTTWISEIMSLINFGGNIDLLNSIPRGKRVPFLEMLGSFPGSDKTYSGLEEARSQHGKPRLLKTHVPYEFIAAQVEANHAKVVVVIRNIRDVLVSFYHFYQNIFLFGYYKGTWSDYFNLFKQKRLQYGDWLKHVLSYWRMRHLPNVHIVFYENAVDNLKETVESLAKFMGKDLEPHALDAIVEHSTFSAMQGRAANLITIGNSGENDDFEKYKKVHLRQGTYGGWKNYFTKEQDDYVKEHYDSELHKEGLVLKY